MLEKKLDVKGVKEATREHLATDMGTGSSSCSNCNYDLGSNPMKNYDQCPGCGYGLKEGSTFFSQGGTDFPLC